MALAVGCAAYAPIATAFAQGTAGTGSTSTTGAGTFGAALVTINGKSVSSLAQTYIGIADCNANVTLQFQLNGIPADKQNIDVWIGESCIDQNRVNTTLPGACQFVNTFPLENKFNKFMVPIKAKSLVADGNCEAGSESTPKINFLALNNAGKASTESASNSYAKYAALQVDLLPPQAPTSVKGGRGGSEIPVSWKVGDTHLKGFVVYVDGTGMEASAAPLDAGSRDAGGRDAAIADAGGRVVDAGNGEDGGTTTDASVGDGGRVDVPSGSADCGATLLVAGRSTVDLPTLDQLKRKVINDRNATSTTVFPVDLSGLKQASVAVVAVDLAGNESAISNVVCVEVVPTKGFIAAYRDEGGQAAEGCPCSAMGPVQIQNGLPIGLTLLALVRSRRKRYS